MKLYLSSQRLGKHSNKLLELIGNNKNVVVVANAIDDKPIVHRKNRVKREIKMLNELGLNAEELDLRKYFGRGQELKEYLEKKSLIWVRGGNVFILRRAMEACEFDRYILPMIKNGHIAFGGYSAGTIIAGKDLLASELVDDIYQVPEDYPVAFTPSKGLKLLNYYLVPHYDSEEEYGKDVRKYVTYLKSKNKKVVTMCDGEVFYTNNDGGIILK